MTSGGDIKPTDPPVDPSNIVTRGKPRPPHTKSADDD